MLAVVVRQTRQYRLRRVQETWKKYTCPWNLWTGMSVCWPHESRREGRVEERRGGNEREGRGGRG